MVSFEPSLHSGLRNKVVMGDSVSSSTAVATTILLFRGEANALAPESGRAARCKARW